MNCVYCEKDIAGIVGLSRRALNRFRSESLKEGVDWEHVTHESRQKTALSESGLILLCEALKNGSLTGGSAVTVDIAEIKKTALLSGLPTGAGTNQWADDRDQRTDNTEPENSEKKPPFDETQGRRQIRGLLPAPPGCVCGPAIEAVLVVFRNPSLIANKRTLVCKIKPGQMPARHEEAMTDESGTAYCRVKSTEKFIIGMEIPARFDRGNVWEITRPCPRRKGKW